MLGDVFVVDAVVAVAVAKGDAACHRVRIVSTGWHAKTAAAPDDQPATRSMAQSDKSGVLLGGADDEDDAASVVVALIFDRVVVLMIYIVAIVRFQWIYIWTLMC